jgi:hypothetical protein
MKRDGASHANCARGPLSRGEGMVGRWIERRDDSQFWGIHCMVQH